MKKSECFYIAMMAVLNDGTLGSNRKLEVIEVLITEKKSAEWGERFEENYEKEAANETVGN